MKPSRNVRTKIALGYALIIVVCILSVGFVYRQVERFTEPDDSRAQVQTRRSLVNQTLYHLYQAEGYGQFLIAGYPSYERRYRDELRVVREHLDSLGQWGAGGSDSLQRNRLDSISSLIDVKERSTLGLQRTIRSAGTATLLNKNIRQLLPPDSVRADSAARTVVRQDTVTVPRRKRGFFRRLGDVFRPPKEDSSVVISTRVIVDSLPAAAVSDTIAGVLRNLQDRVTSERLELYERAWNDGNTLKYSNRQINEKIYRLLNDFEQEETAYLLARMNGRAEVKRRASLILGGIAATAIVLMLLFVWILWRDINRSNRYKRELEEANRSNEALLAAREKLMLTITHDIKAPLSSIMGYIDLLVRLTGEKRQGLYLRNMKASADHLLSLVGNLLDFYRLDANKVEINEVAFNPAELFAQIGAGFAPVAAAKGIGLQTRIDPSAECEVAGDPFRIRQITDNLLSNALKFTDRGSVTIAAELHDGNLIFSVKDTGRGIARAERERIFGEFVRLSSAQGVGGVGLGLSIVDRLVKLLGGRIYLESQPGRGSKFSVCVPVKSAAGVLSERKGEAPAGSGPATTPTGFFGIRCLLVDDDALQLEMAGAMCRQSGCEVECCAYPEYAAKLVAEHRFDVVLTDIQMPGTDGFEVLDRIRAFCPELPVVAVSARSDNRADYLGRGFTAVVRKPFSAGELTDAIRVALGRDACGAHDEPQPAGDSGQPAVGAPAVAQHTAGCEGAAEDVRSVPDFDALTAFAREDTAAAARIIRSFAEQTAANCVAFAEASAKGDTAGIAALAHKMLPLFTMLRTEEITAQLRLLERLEGPLTPDLLTRIGRMLESVDEVVKQAQKRYLCDEKR